METVPLIELSSLAEDIHAKTWEASQNKQTRNIDLDMREHLEIAKTLQFTQIELVNNSTKITEIGKRIKKDSKKKKEVEVNPTYSEEKRHLNSDRKQYSKYYHKAEKILNVGCIDQTDHVPGA